MYSSTSALILNLYLSTCCKDKTIVSHIIFLWFEASSRLITELPELTNEHLQMLSIALREGKASSNHIRVNIVGNQGVGKTTLVQRLQRTMTSCKGQVTEATEALAIDRITLRCIQAATGESTEWQTDLSGKTICFFPFLKSCCV